MQKSDKVLVTCLDLVLYMFQKLPKKNMEKEQFQTYNKYISQYMNFLTSKQSPKQNPTEHEIFMKNAIEHTTFLWLSDVCINKAMRLACSSNPLRLRDYLVFLFNISSLPNLFTSGERFVALECISTIIQKCIQYQDPDLKKVITMIIDYIFTRFENAPPEQLFEIVNCVGRLPPLGQSYQIFLSKFAKERLRRFGELPNLEKEAVCELISRLPSTLLSQDLYSTLKQLVSMHAHDPKLPETTKAYLIFAYILFSVKIKRYHQNNPNLIDKLKKLFLSAKDYQSKKLYVKALYFIMKTGEESNKAVREFLMDVIINSEDIAKDYAYETICKDLQRQKNHEKDNEIAATLSEVGYSHVLKHIKMAPNQYVFVGLMKIALCFPKYYSCVKKLVDDSINGLITCPPFGRVFLATQTKNVPQEDIAVTVDHWPEPQKNITLSADARFVYHTRGYIFQVPAVNNFDFFNIDECFDPIPSFNYSPVVPIFTDQIAVFIALMENKNAYDDLLPIASITFKDQKETPGRQKPSVTLLSLLDNFSGNVFFQLLYSIVLYPDMLEHSYGKGIIHMIISNNIAKIRGQRKKY